MASRDVETLTRQEVVRAAKSFKLTRKMTKWTVIVDGRELPARLLLLYSAGVAPNDPTNTYMAVDKLKALGFDTRYEGKSV